MQADHRQDNGLNADQTLLQNPWALMTRMASSSKKCPQPADLDDHEHDAHANAVREHDEQQRDNSESARCLENDH